MTLTYFLLARFAEDEANFDPWQTDSPREEWMSQRLLADVAAKRRILDWYAENVDFPDIDEFLAILALPYADHPDYREEWRP